MTRDPFIEDGIGPETAAAETGTGIGTETGEVLRRGLQTRADLFTISSPPIAAVRRRAQRRRRRRGVIQGVSGVAVMCAVVGGVVAWSPARDDGASPAAGRGVESSPALRTLSTSMSTSASSAPPSSPASDYLVASDLGPGWTGPVQSAVTRPGLALYGQHCTDEGYFPPQKAVTAPRDRYYDHYSAQGKNTDTLHEAIYTFAAGTGPGIMEKAHAALQAGCGTPQFVKLLATPSTVADEAIVFTVGGDGCNILVRSGDRVASAAVDHVPSGQDGAAWTDELAKQMATRLTAQ